MSTAPPHQPDQPPLAALPADVLDLRRNLVRRSGVLRVHARALRGRGSLRAAGRLEQRALRLLALSRRMG